MLRGARGCAARNMSPGPGSSRNKGGIFPPAPAQVRCLQAHPSSGAHLPGEEQLPPAQVESCQGPGAWTQVAQGTREAAEAPRRPPLVASSSLSPSRWPPIPQRPSRVGPWRMMGTDVPPRPCPATSGSAAASLACSPASSAPIKAKENHQTNHQTSDVSSLPVLVGLFPRRPGLLAVSVLRSGPVGVASVGTRGSSQAAGQA